MVPKVSIIVPIYNVEKYLDRCITSLQNQTIKDIEIILINDGSKDNSLSICQFYASKDTRIKIIDKMNGGVSSARNAGIQASRGEYIGFVDPDDWIDIDMYKNMYEKIQDTKSDIVISNYIVESQNKKQKISLPIDKDILNKDDILDKLIPLMISRDDLNGNSEYIMGSVWRILVKKDKLYTYNIRFYQDIYLMEDLIFCLELFLKCEKIAIDRGYYYHYINNNNSAMTMYRNNMYVKQKEVFYTVEKILKNEGIYDKLNKRMEIRYINIHISSIINEIHQLSNNNTLMKLKNIKHICEDDRLKFILKNTNLKKCNIRKRILINSIKNNIYFYPYIYYILVNYIKNYKLCKKI